MFFHEKKQMMICVTGVLTVAGFMLLRYLPLQRMMRRIEDRRQVAEAAIAEAMAKKKRMPVIKEQLEELQKRVENFDQNVPLNRDLGGFLRKIAALMDAQELSDQQIQPGTSTPAKELRCIPIIMQCKGNLTQVFEFFRALQSLDRVVRIGQVLLRNDSEFSGQVRMETDATIFYRVKPEKG